MPLSERVVIVTGGGAGIGLGIVEAAGALGAHIVVAEKNVALAESVAALGRLERDSVRDGRCGDGLSSIPRRRMWVNMWRANGRAVLHPARLSIEAGLNVGVVDTSVRHDTTVP